MNYNRRGSAKRFSPSGGKRAPLLPFCFLNIACAGIRRRVHAGESAFQRRRKPGGAKENVLRRASVERRLKRGGRAAARGSTATVCPGCRAINHLHGLPRLICEIVTPRKRGFCRVGFRSLPPFSPRHFPSRAISRYLFIPPSSSTHTCRTPTPFSFVETRLVVFFLRFCFSHFSSLSPRFFLFFVQSRTFSAS